ncbi:MAG TPA: FAD-dependent oxidoreductase [Candidatus Thermoplasmatota archaeon]|nr:FAD-dependent oxidoreductase [Candidatus Thermoplasmatota archaeon]
MNNKNYILGGGITAASFCYHSKKNNNIIFEKEDNLNGRIKSIPLSNSAIEVGAQFFCREDYNVYNLIKELKLGNELVKINLDNFTILHNNQMLKLKHGNSNSFSEIENKELIKFISFLKQNTIDIFNKPDQKIISMNFEEWYRKEIGSNTDWFINALVRAITFTNPFNLSALYGLLVCSTFFEDCFSLRGGLENLNKKLLSISKPKILTKHEVKKIKIRNNQVESLIVNGKAIQVDKKDFVISTVPSKILSKLLPESNLSDYLRKIEYGKCGVTVLKTKKNLLNHGSGILSTKSKGISIIIDESAYTGMNFKKGYITILTPYINPKDDIFDISLKEAKDIMPELENNIEEKRFYKWEYGLPIGSPKIFELQRKILENDIENLLICGDYIGMPSLDACIESSKMAAKFIDQ